MVFMNSEIFSYKWSFMILWTVGPPLTGGLCVCVCGACVCACVYVCVCVVLWLLGSSAAVSVFLKMIKQIWSERFVRNYSGVCSCSVVVFHGCMNGCRCSWMREIAFSWLAVEKMCIVCSVWLYVMVDRMVRWSSSRRRSSTWSSTRTRPRRSVLYCSSLYSTTVYPTSVFF